MCVYPNLSEEPGLLFGRSADSFPLVAMQISRSHYISSSPMRAKKWSRQKILQDYLGFFPKGLQKVFLELRTLVNLPGNVWYLKIKKKLPGNVWYAKIILTHSQ